MKQSKLPISILITCGGRSSRMGKAKALLNYHGMPQYKWLLLLCEKLGLNAAISCKEAHKDWYDGDIRLIFDREELGFEGPMLALASGVSEIKDKPILLLGCDYPLLSIKDLMQLIHEYEKTGKSTAFYQEKTSMYEPLLAIYHPDDYAKLDEHYKSNQFSLQVFLRVVNATKVIPAHENACKSFDTPEDFLNFR